MGCVAGKALALIIDTPANGSQYCKGSKCVGDDSTRTVKNQVLAVNRGLKMVLLYYILMLLSSSGLRITSTL